MVGNLKCFFISCYRKGQVPILSIGKAWHLSLLLFAAALPLLGIFSYFDYTVVMVFNPKIAYISFILIIINLLMVLKCLLGDPGIVYESYMYYNEKHKLSVNSNTQTLLQKNDKCSQC